MTKLEEEFKNRFKDQQSFEGIDSEGLWNDITSSLDDVDGVGASPRANFKYIGLVLFAILATATVTYLYNGNQENAATKTSLNESFEMNDSEISGDMVNDKTINARTTNYDELSPVNESTSILVAKKEPSLPLSPQDKLSVDKEIPKNDRLKSDQIKKDVNDNKINGNIQKVSSQKKHDESAVTTNVIVESNVNRLNSLSESKNKSLEAKVKSSVETVYTSDGAKKLKNANRKTDEELLVDEAKSTNNKAVGSFTNNESRKKVSIDVKSKSVINPVYSIEDTEKSTLGDTQFDQLQLNVGGRFDFIKTTMQNSIPSSKFYVLRTNPQSDTNLDYYSDNKQLPLEVGILMGANTGFVGYKVVSSGNSELQSELEKSYKNDFGFSGSLSLTYRLNRKWYLESGVDVLSIRSKFDYIQEIDSNVSYGFQLIELDVDIISGDTINEIYQEQFAPAIRTRTVLHHNNASAISIPISIGRKYAMANINVGASAGIIFRYYKNQRGKLLNHDGDIMSYNDINNGSSLYNGLTIGYRLSPFIEKAVGDKIKIRLRSLIDFQPAKELRFHELKQGDSSISLQLGLIYKF